MPLQYKSNSEFIISHNYLSEQFSDVDYFLSLIRKVALEGDFTLGEVVNHFELKFAKYLNVSYALGVGSGTDALFLGLKALGIGPGHEVITTPFSFIATTGAIVQAGALPVFCDVSIENFNLSPGGIIEKIGPKTRAVLPVHWAGRLCDMDAILSVTKSNNLRVIEDACHAFLAEKNGKYAGTFGDIGCFSLHPLKNLNVWGDGGVIVSNSKDIIENLSLLRNHGLIDRNTCEIFGVNSRLDTIQAVIGLEMLKRIESITERRILNANKLDERLRLIDQLKVPDRLEFRAEVFHLYNFLAENRNELVNFLKNSQIDAKIHYPTPIHLQPASKALGYKKGDFPNAEFISERIISLPVHEYISDSQIDFIATKIEEFYK